MGTDEDAAPRPAMTHDELLALHQALELPRAVEKQMLRLIRHGRISKWFSGYGQEAIAVGCVWGLHTHDVLLPLHRNVGVWTTRGVPLKPLLCQIMGRVGGYTQGRDRTFHFGIPERRIVGMISHLGSMLPVACGIAQAAQLRGDNTVVLAFCGDGATREGDFHEALSLASLWKLPVLFVVENNGYGLSTPTSEAVPIEDIALAATSYGMTGTVVDGNDVLCVIDAVRQAATLARKGEGPSLLEMKTFRRRGHEEASGTKYVPQERIDEWAQKDPIDRFERYLLTHGVMSATDIEVVRQKLTTIVEEASEYAFAQPTITGNLKSELAAVYALPSSNLLAPKGASSEKRFLDAISEGLRQAMEKDETIVLLGQDVAEYGGVFKVSEGLLESFGHARVRNTPIIESGAVGASIGLALEGFKPVVEMQYADFIACGFNQIVNNLAKTHYRWGAPLNVTIRAPFGGNIGAGPFHSQSMEAWFCHVPGLKVVIPGTPADAKGLLMAAIDDPNPVLFFEHKYLYRSIRGPVCDAPFHVEIGRAHIARKGEDVTIVTYGLGLYWALEEAAWQAAEKKVSVEVLDLRTLVPWDQETVMTSIRKTNRVVVLHEATVTCGFGAEVAAHIAAEGFSFLDAPPLRVAAEDLPVPFATQLEQEVFSARPKLRPALKRVMAF